MNQFNEKLIQLWINRPGNITDYIPQFYPEFPKKKTLVIGLNPSFSERGYNNFLANTRYSDWLRNLNERFSFNYFTNSNPGVEDYIEIEKISQAQYPYYTRISEITSEWLYIDLFHVRVTEQERIRTLINRNTDFLIEQLEMTLQYINEIEPKIILVVNGLASNIIRQKCNLTFNEAWGTYSMNACPIFLSGMLTGPGAMDKGSFERLRWHFNYVLGQI